jgi:hypothetical protein
VLFLGSAETIGSPSELFAPLQDGKWRFYQRLMPSTRPEWVDFPTAFSPVAANAPAETRAAKPVANLQTLVDSLLLRHFTPAAVLVDAKGDILYVSGRTGNYLEPAAGQVN